MNEKRLTVYFRGRVQGVGFRYTTERLSRQFPITGFVRNLQDGRVEIVAEGLESSLGQFLNAIQTSFLATHIEDLETVWTEPEKIFKRFEIRH